MSLNDGIGSKGVPAVPDMNIGAADTDPLDLKEDFTGPGHRYRDIPEFDPARRNHHRLSHLFSCHF
jgi:hypothetical protein